LAISAGDTDLTGVDVPEEMAGLGDGFEIAGLEADGDEPDVDVAGTRIGALIIGFGNEVSIAAVSLGAQVIEKHFTISNKLIYWCDYDWFLINLSQRRNFKKIIYLNYNLWLVILYQRISIDNFTSKETDATCEQYMNLYEYSEPTEDTQYISV
jgi:hypothetical protein